MALAFVDILTKLQQQKADLLSELAAWPHERLSHRPTPVDWCVLEMLDHIVKTEIAILSSARVGLKSPHRIGITDTLRTAFLERVFTSDRRVKVPGSARHVLPSAALEFQEIGQRWNEAREDLKAFVSGNNPDLLSKGIFKHPVGGWMGMREILRFFSVHLIHHRYQLHRIMGSATFAAV